METIWTKRGGYTTSKALVNRVNISCNIDGEYRVPGRDRKREEEAYYTNDKQDAINTARLLHGSNALILINRRIPRS